MARQREECLTGEASLQSLALSLKMVRCCGVLWSDGDYKMYMLQTLVIISGFILSNVTLFTSGVSAAGNVVLLFEAAALWSSLVPSLLCLIVCFVRRRNMLDIIEIMRKFVSFARSGKENWKSSAKRLSTAGERRLTIVFAILGQTTVVAYMLKPMVSYLVFGQELAYPIKQLVMFESTGRLSFFTQYCLQFYLVCCCCQVRVYTDLFCLNIIACCSHQFRMLSSMILSVDNTTCVQADSRRGSTLSESEVGQSSLSYESVNIFVNRREDVPTLDSDIPTALSCDVMHEERLCFEETFVVLSEWHQEILKISGEVAKFLSPVMLSHYLVTSITLCMMVYALLNGQDTSLAISKGSNLLLLLVSIFMLGWSSSEVYNQSLLVADAVYFCNWHDLSLNAKKNLMIMMARAQRPVIMKAGPFGSMSLETCKQLIEATYSYLNVLNNMN